MLLSKTSFCRKSFLKRAATTSTPGIPDGLQKKDELLPHHEIMSIVKKYEIPYSMILNIDQTPSKYAPASTRILAERIQSMSTFLDHPTNRQLQLSLV